MKLVIDLGDQAPYLVTGPIEAMEGRVQGSVEVWTKSGGYFYYPQAFVTKEQLGPRMSFQDCLVVYSVNDGFHHYLLSTVEHVRVKSSAKAKGPNTTPPKVGGYERALAKCGVPGTLEAEVSLYLSGVTNTGAVLTAG